MGPLTENGDLPPHARAARVHLAGCARCRKIAFDQEALAAVADTSPPGTPTPPTAPNDSAVTDEAPGRHQVIRELGRGGQARVFVAFDHHLGREVAMKVPHLDSQGPPQLHAQTVLRFLREARTLRAALTDTRTAADRLLLLPNFVAVCNAVAHAHSRGVLHRDLKPDNVVIGALGETVVLDWGLGRLQGDTTDFGVPTPQLDDGVVRLVGNVIGTPSYMSPEQALGAHDRVGERSDVWSLGAVLYEILTGYPPFLGATAQPVVSRVKTGQVMPVLTAYADAPRALAAVARHALERDPARRYASAQALSHRWKRP